MRAPEATYLFHILAKSRREVYVYVADKNDWDKHHRFPSLIPEIKEEALDDKMIELDMTKEESGIYRAQGTDFKSDVIDRLIEAGFEAQDDFSDFVERSVDKTEEDDDDDDRDGLLDDPESLFRSSYSDIIDPDRDPYSDEDR